MTHTGLRLGLLWFVVYLGLRFTSGLIRSYHQVASKRMVRTHTNGKIVFVSSVLGYFGMIGYSTYSPGKHAIRGKLYTD
jgi:NAD(P)-dependent dehydrogenase (short-subunit alcohol dehydrogenase family)